MTSWITTRWLIAVLAAVIVSGQEREAFLQHVYAAVDRYVALLCERITVDDSHAYGDKTPLSPSVGAIRVRPPLLEGNVDHNRLPRIQGERFAGLTVISGCREVPEWKGKKFYPTFIPTTVGGDCAPVCQLNLHPWSGAQQVIDGAAMCAYGNVRPLGFDDSLGVQPSSNSVSPSGNRLDQASDGNDERNEEQASVYDEDPEQIIKAILAGVAVALFGHGIALLPVVFFGFFERHRRVRLVLMIGGMVIMAAGLGSVLYVQWRIVREYEKERQQREANSGVFHAKSVTQNFLLTSSHLCNTIIPMANVLGTDKQITVIGALAEGSSIRAIERMTGVHRDTIMRLGVRVGQGCAALLDQRMRNLDCQFLQFDEIWGFIGKKERHRRPDDDPQYGNVWTFCAIDADTKLVPSFKVGKRDHATARAFVADVSSGMKNRVQISTDALAAYVGAIDEAFGSDVDYAQIVKTYFHDESQHPERKYSAPEIVTTEKKAVIGDPDMELASTSYVERLNGTTRLHMRRLTRLTYAFSKRLENFEAAVALHFAYYNLVKRHNTLRCTPAMAAGVEASFWSVGQLVEAAT